MVRAHPDAWLAHLRYLAGGFSRLRRHLHPFKGNRDHTYHRLMQAGIPSGRAVSLLHLAALTLDIFAILAISLPPLASNFYLLCLSVIGRGSGGILGLQPIVYFSTPR